MNRGLRNNNPLNIRHSADRWQGARITQTDKSFVQFESMAYGYRAGWKVLDTYWKRFAEERLPYNVRNIIARWAPPSENDTEAYIRSVTLLAGLGGNENIPRPLRFYNFGHLDITARLICAMACVECGLRMDQINMDDVWQGYDLAFPKSKRWERKHTHHGNGGTLADITPYRIATTNPEDQHKLSALDEYWDWSPYGEWG